MRLNKKIILVCVMTNNILTACAGAVIFFLSISSSYAQTSVANPDYNRDCALDSFDFIDFQSGFALKDAKADIDEDGAFTLFDYIDFQSAFAIYSDSGETLPGCGASGPAILHVAPDGEGTACIDTQPCSLATALGKAASDDLIQMSRGNYGDVEIRDVHFDDYVTLRGEAYHESIVSNLVIENVSYLRVDGIANHVADGYGSATNIHSSENIALVNAVLVGPGRHSNDSALNIWDSSHVLVENSDVSKGNRVVHTNSQHVTLRNNILHESSGTTVRITASPLLVEHLVVDHNTIFDADHSVAEYLFCHEDGPRPYWGSGTCDSSGEYIHASDENPHENLIVARGVQNAVFSNNLMYNTRALGLTIRDGADDSVPGSGENIQIYNNIIAAELRASTGSVSIRNNTITGSVKIGAKTGTFNGVSRLEAFENNIVGYNMSIYFCPNDATKEPRHRCTAPTTLADGAPINRNIIRAAPHFDQSVGMNDLLVQGIGNNVYYPRLYVDSSPIPDDRTPEDPLHLLKDPANLDFRPIPGAVSSCHRGALNCGVSLIDYVPLDSAPEFDRAGNPRIDIPGIGSDSDIADVGGYEYDPDSSSPD